MALLAALQNSAFSTWLLGSDSIWAFPTVLTLHTVGMMVLVGSSFALDLRLLGAAPGIPLDALRILFPVMWSGFAVNFVTGSMLFAADATTKAAMPLFVIKMGLVVLGLATVVLARRVVYRAGSEPDITPAARGLALASLAVWILAITAGRLLGYVG